MLKQDAIDFFGNKSSLARAAGVDRSAVSQWGEVIPEARAARLQAASGGVLVYDPAIYVRHGRGKRTDEVNHENHPAD